MEKNLFQLQFQRTWLVINLGEFAPTRTFFGHTPADKKAKPAEAEAKK